MLHLVIWPAEIIYNNCGQLQSGGVSPLFVKGNVACYTIMEWDYTKLISHKTSVTANSVCMSLFGDSELQVSACYGHHQAALKNMNTETQLPEREGLPLHNGAKIYSILYI
jgi:hypothetical protein